MPVNRKKMNALKKHYGDDKGERIYYAEEQIERKKQGKPPIGGKKKAKK